MNRYLSLALFCLLSSPAWAETVFRCSDARGRLIYSDSPCEKTPAASKSEGEVKIRLPSGIVSKPVEASSAPAASAASKPEPPVFSVYYNPKDAPAERPRAELEAAIRQAAQVWSKGCRVTIRYAGETDYAGPGSRERVVVRWRPDYFTVTHGADGIRAAGTGSLYHGISLLPRQGENFLHVLTHELGHVLGVGHRHKDMNSVMSYLADANPTQPTPGDYLACNLAMKRQFGIDFETPRGFTTDPGAGMSDSEALRIRQGIK